jgi:hypothetical protein
LHLILVLEPVSLSLAVVQGIDGMFFGAFGAS